MRFRARCLAAAVGVQDGLLSAFRLPGASPCLLWTVRIGILLVLPTPLVVSPEVLYPFVVGKAVYARSLIEITFAGWAALVLFDRRFRPSWSWTVAALALSLLVSWIAGALGVSPTRSMWSTYERMQGLFDLTHWFAFTLMAGSVFRSGADWRLLFSVNLACSAVVCAAGLAHHYGVVTTGLVASPLDDRMASTLGNATYLGAYAMVNVLIGVALIVQSCGSPTGPHGDPGRLVRVRDLWALAVLLNLSALWMSASRGALVGLGAAALAFAAYGAWGRVTVARRTAHVVSVAILAGTVAFAVARTTAILDPVLESNPTLRRITALGPADASVEARLVHIRAGLQAFRDRPVIGWGPENFLVAWGRYATVEGAIADYAHSKPVEELTTKGILGLGSYLALWAVLLGVLLRSLTRRSGFDQLQLYLIGATLVAYFVQSLFLFDTAPMMMQFSLLTAFVVSVETGDRAERGDRGAGRPRLPAARQARRDRAAGLLAFRIGASLATILVVGLTITSILFLNVRLYTAASALAGGRDKLRPWPDRLADFTRSIDEFPGLANQARLFLVEATLDARVDMSDDRLQRALDIIAKEAGRSLAEEPQNWRLEGALAAFYQNFAARGPEYVRAARRHIDRAAALAPGLPAVLNVVSEQERLEAAAVAGP